MWDQPQQASRVLLTPNKIRVPNFGIRDPQTAQHPNPESQIRKQLCGVQGERVHHRVVHALQPAFPYRSNGFKKAIPPQICELVIYYCLLKQYVGDFVGELAY